MIRDSINGLEELFQSDIPRNSVILVAGAEGTLKSSLVLNAISNYLSENGVHGLYVSLEEGEHSLLRTMETLGIQKAEGLHIFDYKDVRREWDDQKFDTVKLTEDMIDYYRERYGDLTVFALDSLSALYSVMGPSDLRRNMYHFFTMLRDKKLTSFLIMESDPADRSVYTTDQIGRPEHFLSDGIIEVGIIESRESIKRYIQIRKMRSTKHNMEKHQLIVDENGLSILGSVY